MIGAKVGLEHMMEVRTGDVDQVSSLQNQDVPSRVGVLDASDGPGFTLSYLQIYQTAGIRLLQTP